ncbi:MAG: hypothetical protein Q7S29_04690 [Candidatus Peribacter sp.]|nr:hypothetical protein [Candidatus Peribacter sp.]
MFQGSDRLLLKFFHKCCRKPVPNAKERLSDQVIRPFCQSLLREPSKEMTLVERIDHQSGILLWRKLKECAVRFPAIMPLWRQRLNAGLSLFSAQWGVLS